MVLPPQKWVLQDFYPLYNGYDNADEIEVSTETLEKYLACEITMDDVVSQNINC